MVLTKKLKVKKPKKVNREAREKKMRARWSNIVRAFGLCERCNSREVLQAHHIVYVGRAAHMRYDINNGICLCRRCHKWIHNEAPTVVNKFLADTLGQSRLDCLNDDRYTDVKRDIAWVDFWEQQLEEDYKKTFGSESV